MQPHEIFEESPKKGAPEWVVTFGDIMVLLLCFFVLLLSFTTMENQRFKVVAGYIREAFGVRSERAGREIPSGDNLVADRFTDDTASRAAIFEELQRLVARLELEGLADVEIEEDGVRLDLGGRLVFEPGSATANEALLPLLDEVGLILGEIGGRARVSGHADAEEDPGPFPSAWELSAARASAIVRHLETTGVASARLQATGYAATRPVAERYTEEGRRKSRRVEIVIEPRE